MSSPILPVPSGSRDAQLFSATYESALIATAAAPNLIGPSPADLNGWSVTLRTTESTHESPAAGVLFINPAPETPQVDRPGPLKFEVTLDQLSLTLPAAPITIPPASQTRWPVNLTTGKVTIAWATANLTTILQSPSGPVTVLTASPDVPVEVALFPGSQLLGAPDNSEILRSTAHGHDLSAVRFSPTAPVVLTIAKPRAFTRVLVLPAAAADQVWLVPNADSHHLVLATGRVVLTPAGDLEVIDTKGPAQAYLFDANVGKFHRLELDPTA